MNIELTNLTAPVMCTMSTITNKEDTNGQTMMTTRERERGEGGVEGNKQVTPIQEQNM